MGKVTAEVDQYQRPIVNQYLPFWLDSAQNVIR